VKVNSNDIMLCSTSTFFPLPIKHYSGHCTAADKDSNQGKPPVYKLFIKKFGNKNVDGWLQVQMEEDGFGRTR